METSRHHIRVRIDQAEHLPESRPPHHPRTNTTEARAATTQEAVAASDEAGVVFRYGISRARHRFSSHKGD